MGIVGGGENRADGGRENANRYDVLFHIGLMF